jgi:hypothetical protein
MVPGVIIDPDEGVFEDYKDEAMVRFLLLVRKGEGS